MKLPLPSLSLFCNVRFFKRWIISQYMIATGFCCSFLHTDVVAAGGILVQKSGKRGSNKKKKKERTTVPANCEKKLNFCQKLSFPSAAGPECRSKNFNSSMEMWSRHPYLSLSSLAICSFSNCFKIKLITFKANWGSCSKIRFWTGHPLWTESQSEVLCKDLSAVSRSRLVTTGGRVFVVKAPRLWNASPEELQLTFSVSTFKSLLETHSGFSDWLFILVTVAKPQLGQLSFQIRERLRERVREWAAAVEQAREWMERGSGGSKSKLFSKDLTTKGEQKIWGGEPNSMRD